MALLTMHSLCWKERSRMPGGTRQKKHFSICLYIFFRCIIWVDSGGNICPDSSLAFFPTPLPPMKDETTKTVMRTNATFLRGAKTWFLFIYGLSSTSSAEWDSSTGFTSPFMYCYLLPIITLLLRELWGKYAPQHSSPTPDWEQSQTSGRKKQRRWMQEGIQENYSKLSHSSPSVNFTTQK